MKDFNKIKTGTIFTIGETPSYPKLKINNGYVDMRDDIVNTNPNQAVLSSNFRELSVEEISKVFEITIKDVEGWIKEKKDKYKNLLIPPTT